MFLIKGLNQEYVVAGYTWTQRQKAEDLLFLNSDPQVAERKELQARKKQVGENKLLKFRSRN